VTPSLPYGRQTVEEDDIRAVADVMRSDWLTQGPTVPAFEEAIAARVGAQHVVAFNSGTAALHAACAAAQLGEDDEVLTSAFSFAASANCARYVGASVDFVDIEPETLATSAEAFVASATARTRAVVPVHYAGRPLDLSPLTPLRERGGVVIEDAAHAIGAVGPHGPVGNCAVSDMACFSFHPVKTMTTGEGGAVTTNSDVLAERLRTFRTHGIVRGKPDDDPSAGDWYYEMVELGMNFRITDMQCALGLSQLAKLDRFLLRRGKIAERYRELFAGTPVELAAPVGPGIVHAYHLVVALLPEGVDRKRVYDAMRAAGVGVQVHYIPTYWHPYYRSLGFERGLCPETERAYARCLSLPVYPDLADADVELVATLLLREVETAHVAT
jgi:UDP-4-amino-4,6-dideoxy-N-acetyl-beta-L-altrosamine transaminase